MKGKKKLLALLGCVFMLVSSTVASADMKLIGTTLYTGCDLTNITDTAFKAYLDTFDTYDYDFLRDAVEITKINKVCVDRQDGSSKVWEQGDIKCLQGIEYLANVTILSAQGNQIEEIDLSKNTELISVSLGRNKLKKLDVSQNTKLTEINCYENPLGILDVSKNVALDHLDCDNDQLKRLDVSKNINLTDLSCWGNALTALDVSKNTKLKSLDCSVNQITEIDISTCPDLITLVKNNQRNHNSDEDLDYFYSSATGNQILIDPWVNVIANGKIISAGTGKSPYETVPTPETEAKPTPETEAKPTPETEAKPTPETEAKPTPETEAKPTPETEDKPSAGTGSTTVSKVADGTYTVGSLVYNVKNEQATVKKAKKKSTTKLTIPENVKINGTAIPVTGIAQSAFKGMKKLKSVVIGSNVKTIGKNAFSGCKKLKTIKIRTTKLTAKSVGKNAFKGVYKKAKISCPKSKKAFYKKMLLKKGMKKTMKFK